MNRADYKPERYDTIDALRGIAALSVVFWHWQWFYCPRDATICPAGDTPILNDPSIQPFFWLIQPVYGHGWLAVDLFFSISGFVFFYLYVDAISTKQVGAWTFFVNRFSRLYPLHLATLLIVTALQMLYFMRNGAFFIFNVNDPKHFMMQLLLASNWSRSPYSFNGPIWSVSIEVLLYGIFFIVVRTRLTHPVILTLIVLAGPLIMREHYFLGQGIFSFFAGGLSFHIAGQWRAKRRLDPLLAFCTASVVMGATLIEVGSPTDNFVVIIVFPAIILALSINETRLRPIMGFLRGVGMMSYSLYLIHFPLALSFVTAASYFDLSLDPSSPSLLLSFLASLFVLSALTFRFFEMPMQRFLRRIIGVGPIPPWRLENR
jgi:peptidoglycan/LPS O-acetylase OafA/YrhL